MTSIRKTKKALKREIRRLDALARELAKHKGSASALWNLFLYSCHLQHQIESIGHKHIDPWTGEGQKFIPFSKLTQDNILTLIKK